MKAAFPLMERFLASNQLFWQSFSRADAQYGQRFWEVGEEILHTLRQAAPSEAEYMRLLRSFRRFAVESLREQLYAEKQGRGRYDKLEEVYAAVYAREPVMEGYYLPGLLLSQFAFVGHLALLLFYRDRFLPMLWGGYGLEVGPGHGLLTLQALRRVPNAHLTCVEISQAACAFTERLLRSHGIMEERCHICCGSIEEQAWAPGRFQFAICSKVLEHTPDPAAFLCSLYRALAEGSLLYLSTDIGVGSIDHLQLFESPSQVRSLVAEAGFVIQGEILAPVYPGDPNRAGVLDHGLIIRAGH